MALKPGQQPSAVLVADIIDFAAQHTAPYKRIHEVAFIPVIPKSASGKILRRELRDAWPAADMLDLYCSFSYT